MVVRDILRKRLSRLLLEETHQMAGVGKVELVRQLAHVAVGEQQLVFQFLQQALFEQMGGGHAELRHDGVVQRDATHTEHIGIFLNTLHGADMLSSKSLNWKA